MTSPEFIALKARLDHLIHPPAGEDGDGDPIVTPMVKLTLVGDEVE